MKKYHITNMANIYVRRITKETSNKIVTLKILRLWILTNQQKKPVSIEAILMDSEDIIGRIIRIGSIIYVDKAHARKLDIEIQDERNIRGGTVRVLRGQTARIAPTNDKLEGGLTMALQFAYKSIWQEELRVQTTMHATKMLINGDLPEFEDFNMKKKISGNDSVSRSITLKSDIRTLNSEEWLNMDKHRTTSQIKKATELGSYILFVKFTDIGDTWYYNSCIQCKTKTREKKALEICPNTKCGLKMEATVPRFSLKVIAMRSKSNDDTTVVLFEDMVANLIGKSAATFIASLIEDGDEEALPMDFQPILFKDYLIRIRVSREYNIVKSYNDYSVEHLTADERIIGNIAT
ncbi:hypothetical protein OROMI_003820 [Orobanche minor]